MSANSSRQTELTARPFPQTPADKLLLAGILGLLSAAAFWMGARVAHPSLTQAAFLSGQVVTGSLLAWGLIELWVWRRLDGELTEFETWPAYDGVWDRAVRESRGHSETVEESQLPANFQLLVDGWTGQLGVRYALPLLVLWFPVLLVSFHCLSELQPNPADGRLPGFLQAFLPLCVLGAETAMAGSVIWACRLCWGRSLERWKISASRAVWNSLPQEDHQQESGENPSSAHEVYLQDTSKTITPATSAKSSP